MRLLKTGPYLQSGVYTLELIERSGDRIPPYAILSHTWAVNPDEEILFSDVTAGLLEIAIPADPADDGDIRLRYTNASSLGKTAGVQKCENAIRQARLDGYDYLWIDTCCIDKSSSAELSESINSMYRWYGSAGICYAYLDDVSTTNFKQEFENARYWTRGWCLQELIAPHTLQLFGKRALCGEDLQAGHWESLGMRSALTDDISIITGIRSDILRHHEPVSVASIAERMSWAAKRQTSREEDLAYCLMGLFDVNMSMLYGEGGRKAFLRLQQEIMRDSDDQSIFAWTTTDDFTDDDDHGLLADNPRAFGNFGPDFVIHSYADSEGNDTYTMTNRGLNITLHILPPNSRGVIVAALGCPVPHTGEGFIGVYLKKLPIGTNRYVRVRCSRLIFLHDRGKREQICVRQVMGKFSPEGRFFQHHFFVLRKMEPGYWSTERLRWKITHTVSAAADSAREQLRKVRLPEGTTTELRWSFLNKDWWSLNEEDRLMIFPAVKRAGVLSAAIIFENTDLHWLSSMRNRFVVMLGQSSEYQAGVDVRDDPGDVIQETLESMFRPRSSGTVFTLKNVGLEVMIKLEEEVYDGNKLIFVGLAMRDLTFTA